NNVLNNYVRAIEQLDGTLTDTNGVVFANSATPGPNSDGSFSIDDVISFDLDGSPLKKFPDFLVAAFPGIPGTDPVTGADNNDNFADETLTYLALTAGVHVFGVDVAIDRTDFGFGGDNGYVLSSGVNPRDQFSTVVGQFQRTGDNFNDRENTNEFTFLAPVTGVYPFRLVHWKNFSGATLAWYSVDPTNGQRILINDPSDARSIKAYRASTVPREPYVAEVSPLPGGQGVAATTPIIAVIGNDDLAVNKSSIKLFLNGAQVTPAISTNGNFTTVLYNPNASRTTATNDVQLVYSDNGASPKSFTNNWSFTIVVSGSTQAQVTGQWDFNGDLTATVGKDLKYFDGTAGESVANTVFGTTTSFGIPDIGGVPTKVMLRKIGGNSKNIGYIMDHQIAPNGGGQLVNQYTIIFDVYKAGGTTTLFNSQTTNNTTDGSIFWQNNDIGQGAGGYVTKGTATSGVWHRIALAADMGATPPVITKFVDGIKQQDWVQPGLDLPRRSWQHTVLLFADGDGDDMADTYVSSVQVRNGKLSDAQLAVLGKPTAAKIPQVIPETHVTGQWDFQFGDLSASVGKDLQYFDGTAGESFANTVYGTTSVLGVPEIDGSDRKIMLRKLGGNSRNIGYIMDHLISPNGGGQLVNQYTIIFDTYKAGGTATLFNCQNTNNTTDGSIFWQGNDIGQGAGGYVSKGTATSGVWHRIALAADMGANPPVITKFVDGIKQQDWVQPGKDLPRRSWQHTVLLLADGDGDDVTDTYVSSIQVSSVKMTDAQLVALGKPTSGGIPIATPVTTVTGQWDFDAGDLSATIGKDLLYFDGTSGESVANSTFGTTTELGVPDIDGTPAHILLRKTGGNSKNIGYIMDHQIPPNGGGQLVNQYTIIFDIYKNGGTTTLFNCQNTNNTTDGSIFWQGNDIGQGAGGYVSLGTATSGTWHRIALAADMAANPPVITKFVDGIKQDNWVQPGKDLPRRSWQHTVLLIADGDGDDMTDTYINSIQVRSTKLSDAELVALGGPSAGGIPVLTEAPVVEELPVSLTITRSGSNLTISWPAASAGYILETTPSLGSPVWTPVSGVANNSVTFPGAGTAQFYRLRK
ncbi:MAG: hypothetical protein JWM99_1793, partial [Verrucomicrobiales bacterium]|nr:hypothetical protein [Verrucomicrobiales bacterium]